MFRLEAELELLTAPDGIPIGSPSISLRGYKAEVPVAVTGQFINVKPLSVSDIVGFCPAHRDLYLRKKKGIKKVDKSNSKSWARAAGPLIQNFMEYVYDSMKRKKSPNGVGNEPTAFRREIIRLLNKFVANETIRKQLNHLSAKVATRYDLNEDDLRLLLFNSAVHDLFYLQGALNYSRTNKTPSKVLLSNLQTGVKAKFKPKPYMKISDNSAPDLLLTKFNAIGDIKSGTWKEEHFLTVAGYALGYESAYRKDINLGLIYMVETANDCIRSSRTIIFWLSDDLRQKFLDRRDHALSTLYENSNEPSVLSDSEAKREYCERCSFHTTCHPVTSGRA